MCECMRMMVKKTKNREKGRAGDEAKIYELSVSLISSFYLQSSTDMDADKSRQSKIQSNASDAKPNHINNHITKL